MLDKQTSMVEAFRVADDVLRQGVQGVSDLVTLPGLINLDFADVRTVMSGAGTALLGIGMGHGEHRAIDAAAAAVSSPLLETSMDGARSILLSITGGSDLSLWEVNEAAKAVSEAAHPDANIIFGAMVDEKLSDQVWVTVVATGYGDRPARRPRRLDEPIGEPRIERTGAPRPRAGRAPLSVASLDVPEFVPRVLARAARTGRVPAARMRTLGACALARRSPPQRCVALAASACGGPAAEPLRGDPQRHDPGRRHHAGAERRRDACKCDGHSHELPDPLLLTAENLADAMTRARDEGRAAALGPATRSTPTSSTTPSGTFSFSDDSPHLGRRDAQARGVGPHGRDAPSADRRAAQPKRTLPFERARACARSTNSSRLSAARIRRASSRSRAFSERSSSRPCLASRPNSTVAAMLVGAHRARAGPASGALSVASSTSARVGVARGARRGLVGLLVAVAEELDVARRVGEVVLALDRRNGRVPRVRMLRRPSSIRSSTRSIATAQPIGLSSSSASQTMPELAVALEALARPSCGSAPRRCAAARTRRAARRAAAGRAGSRVRAALGHRADRSRSG